MANDNGMCLDDIEEETVGPDHFRAIAKLG